MFTMGAMVYDAGGSRVAWKAPDSVLFISDSASLFDNCVSGLVPRVLSGKPVVRVPFPRAWLFGVIVLGRPIYQNGEVTHALFLLRDLHDLYDTLMCVCGAYTFFYLGAAACLLSAMHRRQKYVGMQRDYVANVSHDLKSPISSIRALTETMYKRLPENDGDFKRYCGCILRETVALDQTVRDILELSAVQSRQADLSKEKVQMEALFGGTLEKYATLCYDMMIEFQVSDTLFRFPPVRTNHKNMARLLDILWTYAVKFVAEVGKITVEGWADAKKVTVCVRDNGPGIRRADQGHIFERFYMGDLSHNAKGSGLGLAIAREIAAALDEQLWVESSPGKGAAFFFTIHFK